MSNRRSPVERVSPEIHIQEPEGRSIRKLSFGAAAVCALFLMGFFCGLYKNGGGLASLTKNVGGQVSAPTQADNAIPIAPALGDASAPGDLLARAQLENELLYT
ncbi:MAG: hypothetical protein WB992_13875, partial [Bryobacteraceae bacterium]